MKLRVKPVNRVHCNFNINQVLNTSTEKIKLPTPILENIFAFSPNRDTLGGTAYLIVEKSGNILIDSPHWDETNRNFIIAQGGVSSLIITHRTAIGKAAQIQTDTHCQIIIQEQEAYLLPSAKVTTFHHDYTISDRSLILWTAGHTPGSSCFYYVPLGGVLFSGRHLLPNKNGDPTPLRTSKTFHWFRQIRQVQMLLEKFTPETLNYICPGGNTGYLRGKKFIDQAYQKLNKLDFDKLKNEDIMY
jgi:glyoxylase-like metal-dependent hydrolase (beta-lactamase superfamily II)